MRCGSFGKVLSMMMVVMPKTAPKFHPLKTPYPFSLSVFLPLSPSLSLSLHLLSLSILFCVTVCFVGFPPIFPRQALKRGGVRKIGKIGADRDSERESQRGIWREKTPEMLQGLQNPASSYLE